MRLAIAALALAAAPAASTGPAPWGTLADGRPVHRFVLANARGMTVTLTDLGAALVSVRVPDARGRAGEVVVGPADFATFAASRRRYGAIVGRYAGRLSGGVTIDGRRYPLAASPTGVTLHGGDPGFDRALWQGVPFSTPRETGVEFRYVSRDGEQGFPGTLVLRARYALARRASELTLTITAEADRPTVANLTNHVYWNLSGAPTVGCHRLRANAGRYIALDARKLPTGALPAVAGTAYDFRRPRALAPILATGGVDTMLALDGGAVTLDEPESGRRLRVTTGEPGVQLFSGNSFDGSERDGRGQPIARFGGIAIEPEHFPDSPHVAHFPSTRVAPGRPLRWWTRWSFATGPSGPCR